MNVLRQVLGAGQRWGYLGANPAVLAGRNRQPAPRAVRTYSTEEVAAIRKPARIYDLRSTFA